MQSESPTTPGVNTDAENSRVSFPREIPEELANKVRRLDGYAWGVFRNGKPSEQMRYLRRKFSKKLGLSWDHVDRVTRVWMRWTTDFKFERERFGRSTLIIITPQRRPLVLSTASVRRRLAGSIRNYVRQSGAIDVGRKFLAGFFERHGLPCAQIIEAWRTLYYIEGCVCQWKGSGQKRVLRVQLAPVATDASWRRQMGGRAKNSRGVGGVSRGNSPRQSTSGISPQGGKIRKQGAGAPEFEPGSSRAAPEQGGRERSSALARQRAGLDALPPRDFGNPAELSQGAEPQTAFEPPCTLPFSAVGPPSDARSRASRDRQNYRWKPAFSPLQICERWISGAKLAGKANFLAFCRLRPMHAQAWRVKFGAAHAFNFADGALRAGFLDSEICAAYRHGCDVAHAAAVRDYHADLSSDGLREPSQVIAEARKYLARDERSDVQRWAAIFRGDAAPAMRDGADPARGAATPEIIRWKPKESPAPEPARRPADQPEMAPAVAKFSFRSPATFEQHLRARGLTLAELLKLPRAAQQAFVREAQAAQRKSGGGSKNVDT